MPDVENRKRFTLLGGAPPTYTHAYVHTYLLKRMDSPMAVGMNE